MKTYPSPANAISATIEEMKTRANTVHRGNWQGTDVSKKPEMLALEIMHHGMIIKLDRTDLDYYRRQVKPNLPWADDHFEERVCGQPLNPANEWANWPWAKSADKFRDGNGQFDHNYMERYWPKFAGFENENNQLAHMGIRFEYGDLNDVVEELYQDYTTRQAVLPIFFPEDTGYRPGRRKPCSLFYHLIHDGKSGLDIVYHLRSCDLVRHFRDDVYMTIRLLLWVLEHLKERPSTVWPNTRPGKLAMTISNLHCFANDVPLLKEGKI